MITLPKVYEKNHHLCFLLHNIMTDIIVSGEKNKAFDTYLPQSGLEPTSDQECLIDSLQRADRDDERNTVIFSTAFPAILSDMMHCIYESLSAASKGKMSVAFMLIRKPIQESLFVLEEMLLDKKNFVRNLEEKQSHLEPRAVGSIDGHNERIANILESLGVKGVLDPGYIVQLRYDKSSEDSFDAISNKAMHLFTNHPSIKTENLNINFIFSGIKGLRSQWDYYYSRTPYLLFYMYLVIEHVLEQIAVTPEEYKLDMMRRISSNYVLASATIQQRYVTEQNNQLVNGLLGWLIQHCSEHNYPEPELGDLEKMALDGSFPKETQNSIRERAIVFEDILSNKNDL